MLAADDAMIAHTESLLRDYRAGIHQRGGQALILHQPQADERTHALACARLERKLIAAALDDVERRIAAEVDGLERSHASAQAKRARKATA